MCWTLGSRPGQVNVFCSWAENTLLSQYCSPLSSIDECWWIIREARWNVECRGVILLWTSIPFRGEVAILLVTLCYGNQDKLHLGGPIGLSTDCLLHVSLNTRRKCLSAVELVHLLVHWCRRFLSDHQSHSDYLSTKSNKLSLSIAWLQKEGMC